MKHLTLPRLLALSAIVGALLLPPWLCQAGDLDAFAATPMHVDSNDDDSAPALAQGWTAEEIVEMVEAGTAVVMTAAEKAAMIDKAKKEGAEPLQIFEMVMGLIVGLIIGFAPVIVAAINRKKPQA